MILASKNLLAASLLACALAVGCTEDLTPLSAGWTTISARCTDQIASAKKVNETFSKTLSDTKPADAQSPAGEARVKFEAMLKQQLADTAAFEATYAKAKSSVEAATKQGKVDGLKVAIEAADAQLTPLLAKLGVSTKATEAAAAELAAANPAPH